MNTQHIQHEVPHPYCCFYVGSALRAGIKYLPIIIISLETSIREIQFKSEYIAGCSGEG